VFVAAPERSFLMQVMLGRQVAAQYQPVVLIL